MEPSENPAPQESGTDYSASSVENLMQYRTRLVAFVRNRVSDPDLAEDIFQDALLRALRSNTEFVGEDDLLSWFYRILRNAIIDSYRRGAAAERKMANLRSMVTDEMQNADRSELCECFRSLLPEMRPEYRQMIEWLELEERPSGEVADKLGIDTNNLKVRRHRAREQLGRLLLDSCRLCAVHGCLDCSCGGATGTPGEL
ncbi:MAG: sigma-70 family RNA polymerase sigma factor [Leptospiraceae bacterium]|nr:sigma-70 family RNA polymerase sigma factor [Leptospiraceae bacterium]MCB1302806.1 sigma-70 family RNA polymerase sigma factor [Leptospiraceae bacterium]